MPTSTNKLSPKEEEELRRMADEEAKAAAMEAAQAVQVADAANAKLAMSAPKPPPAAPQKIIGDIPVTCLKTEPFCKLGGRPYVLKKGAEIMMDPSHANELAEGGWVAPVRVILSQSRA